MTDVPGNSSTTITVTVGSTTSDTLETVADHDWFKINLTAGQEITITVNGVTLEDPYLYIRDAGGNVIKEDDDIVAGVQRDSQISFKAASTGVYYIDVAGFDDSYAGDYKLVVQPYSPPPLATNDEIASQLIAGYWGGEIHHFSVTQGGTITVNLTALTGGGQILARTALAQWADVLGIRFQEVSGTTPAQINFDDNQEGAFTEDHWANGTTSSADVNISSQWLTDYGAGLNSYTFQAYIHEIGHALGLGHAGNYNDSADFPYDALFRNDSWATSVMSYFSQKDNTYFAGQGFSEDFLVTPMVADIIAIQALYGLSTTTRSGDTVYGFNSNAGSIYDASVFPTVAYTVFDTGGTDTLDFSAFGGSQVINLNPETFSSVNGSTGNVAIARGVVIENAKGGSGADTVVGNDANNVLSGGAGQDVISGAAGADTLNGGDGIDVLYAGNASPSWQQPNLTNPNFSPPVLDRGAESDTLNGGAGTDIISAGFGDTVDGAADLADLLISLGGASSGVTVDFTELEGGSLTIGGHSISNIRSILWIEGSNFDDMITGGNQTSPSNWYAPIYGMGGNDHLIAGLNTGNIYGGAGNDYIEVHESYAGLGAYYGDAGDDTIVVTADSVNRSVVAIGGDGNDTLLLAGDIYGGAGNDTITVSFNTNIRTEAHGDDGDDTITDSGASNTLLGGAGSDVIIGNDGDDLIASAGLTANGTLDLIDRGSEQDRLQGGNDNDVMAAGYGDDVDGGSGTNSLTLSLMGATAGVTLNATSVESGQTIVIGGGTITNIQQVTALYGSNFADTLTASSTSAVNGMGGNDTINGTPGSDRIGGGSGYDTLFGNGGNDTFIDTATNFNGDLIVDFRVGDRIVVTDAIAANFSYSFANNALTFSGVSISLPGVNPGANFLVRPAAEGGVEIAIQPQYGGMALVTTGFGAGPSAGGWLSDDRNPREIADVNGDGRADIVGFGNDGVYVSLATAEGAFGAPTLATTGFGYNPGAGGWSSNDRYPRELADVNGDGRADIVGFGNDGVYVSLGQGSGMFAAPTLAVKAFAFRSAAGGWSSNDTYLRQLADVNGDGRADIVGFGIDGAFVSLGQANGTFGGPTLAVHDFGVGPNAGSWSTAEQFPRELADVNGDHKTDIVGFGIDGVYIALGNGNGTFQNTMLDLGFFGLGSQAGSWTSNDTFPRLLADVNHDGAADIVGFATTGVYVAYSNGDIW